MDAEDMLESTLPTAAPSGHNTPTNRRHEIRAALLAVPFILTLGPSASAQYGYNKKSGKGK